jgi:hypothetical protein
MVGQTISHCPHFYKTSCCGRHAAVCMNASAPNGVRARGRPTLGFPVIRAGFNARTEIRFVCDALSSAELPFRVSNALSRINPKPDNRAMHFILAGFNGRSSECSAKSPAVLLKHGTGEAKSETDWTLIDVRVLRVQCFSICRSSRRTIGG